MKKKLSLVLAVMLFAMAFLTGCGGGNTGGATPAETTGPETTEAGGNGKSSKDSLVLSVGNDVISLDPWYAGNNANWISKNAIYERLFITNEMGEIEPQLAESWKWNEDNTALIVNLRKGVKFHNGEEMKASDVKYSMERAGKSPIVTAQINYIDYANVKIIDDYTVEIPMTTKIAIAEKCIAGTMLYIVNEKFAKENGEDLNLVACGTGPWELVKYTANVDTTFKRFEEYWGTPTPCATMTLRIIQETAQALVELENGKVDMIVNPGMANVKNVSDGNVKDAKLHVQNAHMNIALYFNMDLEPVKNKLVRQAIYYAINVDDTVAAGYQKMGIPATSFVSSGVWGYDKKYETQRPYAYNIQKAKELLAQAGYPNGFEMNIFVGANTRDRVIMSEVIQNNLEQVGIKVKVEALEYSAFRAALVDGKADHGFLFGVTATTGESDNALFSRFYQDIGDSIGLYGWEDQAESKEISELLKRGRETFDDQERLGIYVKAQELLFEALPVIPLSEQTIYFVLRKNLQGFRSTSEYYWTGGIYFD